MGNALNQAKQNIVIQGLDFVTDWGGLLGHDTSDYVTNAMLGTDKADYLAKIEELQAKADAAIGEAKTKYMAQLADMKNRLKTYMQQQGATDSSGKLIKAKDVQNEYLDKDYLSLRQEQARQAQDLGLSQNLKLAKQKNLQGGGGMNPAQVAAALENSVRTSQNTLASDVKGERELAYNKASNQLDKAQQYAQTLTNDDRQSLKDEMNAELQFMGLTQQQLQQMNDKYDNMGDGMLGALAAKGIGGLISGMFK
ncbi:MAG: hypothetical protein ACYDEI_00120 [Erysipelotrichaceae bacterium]